MLPTISIPFRWWYVCILWKDVLICFKPLQQDKNIPHLSCYSIVIKSVQEKGESMSWKCSTCQFTLYITTALHCFTCLYVTRVFCTLLSVAYLEQHKTLLSLQSNSNTILQHWILDQIELLLYHHESGKIERIGLNLFNVFIVREWTIMFWMVVRITLINTWTEIWQITKRRENLTK